MKTVKQKILLSTLACSAVLAFAIVICILGGTVNISAESVLKILLQAADIHIFPATEATDAEQVILLDVRIPRVLLASLVGGGLSIVGCVMQGIFKNPMAEPGILGWSSGGALIAVIVIYSGWAEISVLFLPAGAFFGTLISAFLVYKIASVNGYTPSGILLLTGVALGALFVSLTSLILTIADVWSMKEMLFWLMGGVDARGWYHLKLAAAPVIFASIGITFFAKDLNAMLLGEESATTLGVDIETTKTLLIVLSALIVGACVSVSGVVGFVGLILPHLMRLIVGSDHRVLLPASFLSGAAFLPLADLVARTLIQPEELRLGVITSCLGVPFFLYLLRKNKSSAGDLAQL